MNSLTIQKFDRKNMGDYYKRLKTEAVYGPINSRRLGLSLGINPIHGGFGCNFECSYCQYGIDDLDMQVKKTKKIRFREPSEIKEALEKRLRTNEHYDSLTICGPTEPTLTPHFNSIVDLTVEARNKYRPEIPTSLFTNASRLEGKKLNPLDYVFMKLDAGNEETFKRVNRARGGVTLNGVIDQMKKADVRKKIIQTMIIGGKDGNYDEQNLKDYIGLLKEINPEEVHLYTVLYKTPPCTEVIPIENDRLNQLAHDIERNVEDCKAIVFMDPVEEGEKFRY